jgi:hypothetical protein
MSAYHLNALRALAAELSEKVRLQKEVRARFKEKGLMRHLDHAGHRLAVAQRNAVLIAISEKLTPAGGAR